jgi:hypothetical protein
MGMFMFMISFPTGQINWFTLRGEERDKVREGEEGRNPELVKHFLVKIKELLNPIKVKVHKLYYVFFYRRKLTKFN